MKFKCPHCDSKRISVIESQYAVSPLSKVTVQGYETNGDVEIVKTKFEGIFCRDCKAEWARGEDYLTACGKVKFILDNLRKWDNEEYSSSWEYSFVDDLRCLMNVKDNHKAEDILIKAKVIKKAKGIVCDPESSCFYIYFSTIKQAMDFINGLNKFFADPKNLRKIKKKLD